MTWLKNLVLLRRNSVSISKLVRNYSSSNPSLIKVEQRDGLRTVTLRDPKTRNALSLQMMKELIEAVQNAPALRLIVLRNESPPVFSSGHNLKELTTDHGIASQKNIFATCSELMMAIRTAPVPVIAAVNGLAAAAGCQLVAACDFAFCTSGSSFSTPGANFGLFCSTPGVPLSRKVNRSMSAYMLMTGESIDASQALNSGLVNKVVGDQQEMDTTIQRTYHSIESKSKSVISLGKKFYYEQLEMKYSTALKEAENTMVRNLQFKDCQEGLDSFKTKRKPTWKHDSETV